MEINDSLFNLAMVNITPIHQPSEGNVFNELVKNIVYQQISYKAAESVFKKFTNIVSNRFTPKSILGFDFLTLKSAGLSRQKTQYILNIAEYFNTHNLFNFDWSLLSDKEIIKMLTEIKGVGEWTAQMILIFELKRPDVFPSKDLAIQLVVKELYNLKSEKKLLIKEIEEISLSWKPHRTLASLYLWGYRRKQLNKED